MAIPGHRAPTVPRGVDTYSLGGGRRRTPTTSSLTANLPQFVGPTQLIGVGFAPFTITVRNGAGETVVPFGNLPSGGGSTLADSLRQTGLKTSVQDNYQLLFVTSLQASNAPNGVVFSVSPRAIDDRGVVATTSQLGSRTYRAFQAHVQFSQRTAPAQSVVTGTVTGQLLLARR